MHFSMKIGCNRTCWERHRLLGPHTAIGGWGGRTAGGGAVTEITVRFTSDSVTAPSELLNVNINNKHTIRSH